MPAARRYRRRLLVCQPLTEIRCNCPLHTVHCPLLVPSAIAAAVRLRGRGGNDRGAAHRLHVALRRPCCDGRSLLAEHGQTAGAVPATRLAAAGFSAAAFVARGRACFVAALGALAATVVFATGGLAEQCRTFEPCGPKVKALRPTGRVRRAATAFAVVAAARAGPIAVAVARLGPRRVFHVGAPVAMAAPLATELRPEAVIQGPMATGKQRREQHETASHRRATHGNISPQRTNERGRPDGAATGKHRPIGPAKSRNSPRSTRFRAGTAGGIRAL